jgi:transmembrane sensor
MNSTFCIGTTFLLRRTLIDMNITKQLLEKYFKGLCTEAEAAQVEAYLNQEDTSFADAWFEDMYQESIADMPAEKPKVEEGMRVVHRGGWYRLAAAAVLMLLSLFAWLWQSHQKSNIKGSLAINWDTLANGGQNVKLLSLSDGSKVWLAPHSSLIFSSAYNQQRRELWLNGEAFFEVAQDHKRPFSVHTRELVTTALGTSFNIATANHADSSIQVSLVTGKVAVTAAAFSCILNPGQMVRYNNNTALSPAAFNQDEVLDWKSNKLVFDGTPLADAFSKIQARLGCRIIIDSKIDRSRKVTGTFPAGTSAEHILQAIQFVHGFTIKKEKDNVFEITE